jgi:Bifunctional DNA primase/polymerase, N-terminal/HNH endonuclease
MIETLPRFPCKHDKTPLTRWRNAASADVDDTDWELVGVPTGSITDIDCLDVDVEGLPWLSEVKDRLPPTRTHSTRSGGRHLLWNHAEGLRCSAGRIAKGVDVRADGGYIIYWPRQGVPFDDRPIADWPEWLLRLAQKSSGPWVSDGSIDGIDGTGGLYHGPDNCRANQNARNQSGESLGYWAHTLAFLYMTGCFPKEVDHIDRDGANNRWNNLIEADRSIQRFNSKLYRNNTSGHRGVYWDNDKGKWRAMIGGHDSRVYLGSFDTIEAAVAARRAVEIKVLGCLTEELKGPKCPSENILNPLNRL